MDEALVIPIVAILMPMFLVPAVILMRQSARNREWQHRERMKAMELGLPVPGAEAWAGRSAIAIGAVMPVGVFVASMVTNATTRNDDVWVAAAFVSLAGVIGGVRLAGRQFGMQAKGRGRQAEAVAFDRRHGKPAFNPDADDAIARHC
ncbi:hypothetical protein [Tautonia sociabilis]|uniref:Uncharacterized protein n=1 Tax=Tautonia sociabilis TaxID=2080755 RepID=A0A432MDE7_9BACT|nr:hypothetical protein [Tautonia sociabilis]RUL82338.1 hypothetical protein TsocGM_23575 [Tautonia sociabilis]